MSHLGLPGDEGLLKGLGGIGDKGRMACGRDIQLPGVPQTHGGFAHPQVLHNIALTNATKVEQLKQMVGGLLCNHDNSLGYLMNECKGKKAACCYTPAR